MLLQVTGGLCLFLFGVRVMNDGLRQCAGDRVKRTLNGITGNRFAGLLTGFVAASVTQSSSAAAVMVVVFANAGLLSVKQSIGVMLGANAGAIVNVWIASLTGFSFIISVLAVPAVGIGFILSAIKWKYKNLGNIIIGFGLLFWGLNVLTGALSIVTDYCDFSAIAAVSGRGFLSLLACAGAGMVMTVLLHSQGASTLVILAMAHNGVISYEMAAGMVLGANIGNTFDAVLAVVGTGAAAKRAALGHVLFNITGTLWALPLLKPLLALVDIIIPGNPEAGDPAMVMHLAMLHTVCYTINTAVFLPCIKPFAQLVSRVIREDRPKEEIGHYHFTYFSGDKPDTPGHNILRAEKEIRDMAGTVSQMFARFSAMLNSLRKIKDREKAVIDLCAELKQKEKYVDEMRDAITGFLIECSREQNNIHSDLHVTHLLRIISNIEDMGDECYYICLLLDKSVRKNYIFKDKEIEEIVPYIVKIEKFLVLLQEKLGNTSKVELAVQSVELETSIGVLRKKLQRMSRRQIEADEDIRVEMLFIELVRRIEKLGDFCFDITGIITNS